MDDYYAILGLDQGASPESIKVAYRRLAREYHPDRHMDPSDLERNAMSVRMAQLNEAYETLSDPKRRREYDEQLRIIGMLKSSTVSRSEKSVTKSDTGPVATKTAVAPPRVRQQREGDPEVVRQFSKQLRLNFLGKRDGLDWRETELEGFDWGLEATSWSSHYCAASRGFSLLDPAAAKKFANYSEIVIAQFNRPFRKSHFLFLITFQNLSEWESVSTLLQKVISGDKQAKTANIPIGIVLVDMRQGRTLRLGALTKEEPFHKILQSISSSAT